MKKTPFAVRLPCDRSFAGGQRFASGLLSPWFAETLPSLPDQQMPSPLARRPDQSSDLVIGTCGAHLIGRTNQVARFHNSHCNNISLLDNAERVKHDHRTREDHDPWWGFRTTLREWLDTGPARPTDCHDLWRAWPYPRRQDKEATVAEQDASLEAVGSPEYAGTSEHAGTTAALHEPAEDDTVRERAGSSLPDDLHDLERELCRLPDVSAARIVTDRAERPTEVHILARPGKPAKQVARDVQSVALASFGLELDRRIISVVQLGVNGATEAGAEAEAEVGGFRPVIAGINAETSDLRALVRVSLSLDAEHAVGFAEGSVASTARHRLVATATLDALRQLAPSAEAVDIDSAQIVRVGPYDVAVVTAVFVAPPQEEVVSGSAIVRLNAESDAVARAVLDATNRRLPRI